MKGIKGLTLGLNVINFFGASEIYKNQTSGSQGHSECRNAILFDFNSQKRKPS